MPKKIQQFKSRANMTRRRHVRHIKRLAKKPLFTIPLATFMVLLVIGMISLLVFNGGTPKIKTSDSNIVILDYDKHRQTVPTRAKTVGALLDKLSIHLNSGDVVEPSRDTEIVGDNFRVNVYRAVPVTVIDGESKTFAYSAAATPRSIVKQAGVEVYPEDNLKLLPTENFLTDSSIGERVVINRATPVNVNLYGTPVSLRTHAKTVSALLKEKGITLHDGDTVQPTEATVLTANTQVFVTHKGKQIVSSEEQVAMPTQTVEDDSLSFGVTAVRQQGSVGKKVITYEIELQNGVEVGRRAIQEVVTQQPVTQIVAKGTYVNIAKDHTSVMAAAGIAKSDYVYVEYVIEHESHWNLASVNSTGCAGLGQACPGSKLAAACPAWRTDAICQMKYFNGYAVGRYGNWATAYNFKVSHGWW